MRPAVAIKAIGYAPHRDEWYSSDSMAPVTSFMIASNDPVLYAPAIETAEPGTSRERPAHDADGVDAGLRSALVELADDRESMCRDCARDLRAALDAHPAPETPAPVEARCPDCGALGGGHGTVHTRYGNGGGGNSPCPRTPAPVSDARREDARTEAACAWADDRKDYGISSDPLDAAHKAFMAGRQSVLGTLDAGGVQR